MIIVETIRLKPCDVVDSFERVCLAHLMVTRVNKIYKPVGYITAVTRIISISSIICEGTELSTEISYEVNVIKPQNLIDSYSISKLLESGIFVQLEYAHILIVGGVLKNKKYLFDCCEFSFYDRISFKSLAFRLKKYKGGYVYAIVAEHICESNNVNRS
ncbi:hypothetical protein KM759_gp101 [Lymphocystis disease virus 4]|uniref:Uncharacterized protein n=1 Tax=Lymphocystis disease virus 4 TaxID=2704413 RepID=A0A6B9XMZ8_9VIRU|nr:hypothetical protein KM759_gp101 [Lymphocystis disease virus 4]QHR78528.1 hypothetical protein [Lymphocystis disease virus 4]